MRVCIGRMLQGQNTHAGAQGMLGHFYVVAGR